MGKFIIKQSPSGNYIFNLLANNAQVIANGQIYKTRANCAGGVQSVITNAPGAALEDQTAEGFATQTNPKFELYTDKKGEFRFRLKARNGQIIAVSEGYTTKSACLNGIESVRKNAADSPVENI